MIYIFGYGSLIHVEGINCRNMKKKYSDHDLIPAVLHDFKREFNVYWQGNLFLGITSCEGQYVNGVLFPISPEDIKPFKESECITGNYNTCYYLTEVSSGIETNCGDAELVLTCVSAHPCDNGIIQKYYIDNIKKGLEIRGKDFSAEFIKTTFPEINWQPE